MKNLRETSGFVISRSSVRTRLPALPQVEAPLPQFFPCLCRLISETQSSTRSRKPGATGMVQSEFSVLRRTRIPLRSFETELICLKVASSNMCDPRIEEKRMQRWLVTANQRRLSVSDGFHVVFRSSFTSSLAPNCLLMAF